MEYPRVIANSDGAGVIDQVGKGVTRFKEGQRVWLYNGQRNGRAFGTAAEYIALDETLVQPLARQHVVCRGRDARRARHDCLGLPVSRRSDRVAKPCW